MGTTGRVSALCLVLGLATGCEKTKPVEGRGASTSSATPPATSSAAPAGRVQVDAGADEGKVAFPEVPIRIGETTTVHVKWKTPEGTGVNDDAPFKVRWSRSDALENAPADVKATGSAAREGFAIAVKPLAGAPNATLAGVIDLVVCDAATHAVCVPVKRKLEIEFVTSKAAATDTTVVVALPQARPL